MSPAIKIDPSIQGGIPCFAGTRVPVKSLFDYLAKGHTMDYFLGQFPSVSKEQAIEVLKESRDLLIASPNRSARSVA